MSKTILVAGGCFWCVEADFKKLKGVEKVVSGYAGGETEKPTYENYARGGHREVIEVTYNPDVLPLETLFKYLIGHIDPTDALGSFADRGPGYSPAIYFEDDEEREIAEQVIDEIDAAGIYDMPLAVEILPRPVFWPAEEYHQDYAEKNPEHYERYREGSGREAFVRRYAPQVCPIIPEELTVKDDE